MWRWPLVMTGVFRRKMDHETQAGGGRESRPIELWVQGAASDNFLDGQGDAVDGWERMAHSEP